MPSKTLLIGLDGAEPDLLIKWSQEGLLPTIKSILEDWYHTPIVTDKGFGDGVFWNTLATGVGVGKHGRYFSVQYNPSICQIDSFAIDTDLGHDPFWYYCSKMGAKVGIVDMFLAPLSNGLNGIQVADWMTHDRPEVPRSWPASFINTLSEKYGVDPLDGDSEAISRTEQESVKLHQDIIDRIQIKTHACTDLLRDNQWDLFCVCYCEPHDIGHQSWHWHDQSSPNHPKQSRDQYGDPVLQTYQALDQAIKETIDDSGAENIYLVAGLGMTQQSAFNSIIQRVLGHYCGKKGSRKNLTEERRQMPYFEVPHNMNAAAIRINLKGRDAFGIVEKEDYEKVCAELTVKLEQLCDADTGEPIVDSVTKIHEFHTGKFVDRLPDLFVNWVKPISTQRVRVDAETVFELEHIFGAEFRTGDHTDHALFASNIQYQDQVVTTEAIAPTICRSIGINLPETDANDLLSIIN